MRWITGHGFLRRHNNICQEDDEYISPSCRLCKEGEETPIHLSAECPALHDKRAEIFGERFLPTDEPMMWKTDQLLSFLALRVVEDLEEDEE